MLKHETAKKLSSQWHGGQWSALYQFGSSGVYLIENHLQYLKEVEMSMHPEYDLHPSDLSKKSEKELNSLKEFFTEQGKENGIGTEWHKHDLYTYMIPYITEDTADKIANQVKAVSYMK